MSTSIHWIKEVGLPPHRLILEAVPGVGNVGKPNFTAFQRLAGSGRWQNNEKNPGLLCTIKQCGVLLAGCTDPGPMKH